MEQLKEEEYVHKVYNEIAPHFSQTRYKPWPIVSSFLMEQTVGSVGIDVGCGNGKYLNVNPQIYIIGSDRSTGLIGCAREINSKYNVLVADGLNLPHRENTFDFAISIAVVHHWTTRERRIQAIKHILSKVKSGGRALIYCWALEQGDSRRGYHEGMEQDVLVPWVLRDKKTKKKKKTAGEKPDLTNIPLNERAAYIENWKKEQELKRATAEKESQQEEQENSPDTKYRFYHLYRKGELEEDCTSAGGEVVGNGYEKDNWYVIAEKK
ncbi:hypothetical protein KAFR_0C05480 [Kazachstania africana CBS 2517]|uniref:Methyltransferase type 11 domain-containing protein n=1 Tax=Kazachstania africana (strain ATCC 22294 / BCRC 22015 / CBS 2517 / CECT 1963 / NBRC 1671 / NRRL Y-8276) TaxID=1071382 RepID=H2AT39_KAZAF|nr:hypothetical protein KAFR_0C05480 [Kazachstania africana CBS 2517]CCF57539.1 hypothetical protein KAFR_0C05480 [Kazachstania africana CBS 2517]